MSILINPFVFGAGAGGGGTGGPDGTDFYVEVTIQSSEVASTLTDFPVYLDLSTMPADFWTNVQADGGDIRVTESDGSTRAPVELVDIDAGAETGELHFLASSLSSSSNTVYRIYYGSSSTLSQPAVTDTYGRNAVWSDYEGVWHLGDTVDSTGNGHTLDTAANASNPIQGRAGKIGESSEFVDGGDSGGGDVYTAGEGGGDLDFGANTPFALQVWIEPDRASDTEMLFLKDYRNGGLGSSSTEGYNLNRGGTYIQFFTRAGSGNVDVTETVSWSADTWYMIHGWRTSDGDLSLARNGVVLNTSAGSTADVSNDADLYLGARHTSVLTTENAFDGEMDEARLRNGALSADWVDAEYTNQNTPGTFYSVGSQQAA